MALLRYSVPVQRQLPIREVGRRRRVEAAVSPVQTTVRLSQGGGALALVLRLARCGAVVPASGAESRFVGWIPLKPKQVETNELAARRLWLAQR